MKVSFVNQLSYLSKEGIEFDMSIIPSIWIYYCSITPLWEPKVTMRRIAEIHFQFLIWKIIVFIRKERRS